MATKRRSCYLRLFVSILLVYTITQTADGDVYGIPLRSGVGVCLHTTHHPLSGTYMANYDLEVNKSGEPDSMSSRAQHARSVSIKISIEPRGRLTLAKMVPEEGFPTHQRDYALLRSTAKSGKLCMKQDEMDKLPTLSHQPKTLRSKQAKRRTSYPRGFEFANGVLSTAAI